MEIGKVLTDLRKEKGLSRQELSDKFDISVHTYIKYENESTRPPYEFLVKLADFYNVSTDYLLGRTTVRAMATLAEDEPTEEEVRELEERIVDSYTQMSVETRRECIKVLMQIVGDVFLDLSDEREQEPQDSTA